MSDFSGVVASRHALSATRWAMVMAYVFCLWQPTDLACGTEPLGYQLVWHDEFDGSQLDETSWWYRADEKQRSIQLPSNVEVDNGELVLNLMPLDTPINGFRAAGAGIISQQRFHYGYYETRGKLGDGFNHDFDSATDEGWHHAFWAMAAEADENGHVLTTFPSFRRTEIDGFENGSSVNIGRMSQHVLAWNDQGRITHRLPSEDITFNPPGTEFDWHIYGFEWTPREVRFFVDDQHTKTAIYPVEDFEHDQINLWLTAISTNAESSDQERSEARYDYFRYYEKGAIDVGSGEQLAAGVLNDISAPAGGSITRPSFGTTSAAATGGVSGEVTVQDGGTLHGAGWVFGNVVAESGAMVRVGGTAVPSTNSSSVTTTEDFEGFSPGTAFVSGTPTGLMPNWTFFDLADPGESTTDAVWQITGAHGTNSEPNDGALSGESQMLFQSTLDIDFSLDPGNSPFVGAVAVTDQFDTSGAVDIIEADFVFDGFGDDDSQFLDNKIIFGFRDIDNWFALSTVRGNSNGGATQIDISANVNGDRQNVFGAQGTGDFTGNFPEDTILRAQVVHDSNTGFVSFAITDPNSGDTLAQGSTVDERFMFDGAIGVGVNNDPTGIDNISVTTQGSMPLTALQDLEILGDATFEPGATLQLDLGSPVAYDQLLSTGRVALAGTLEAELSPQSDLALGDVLTVVSAAGGITGEFDAILVPDLSEDLSFVIRYLPTSVEIEIVQGADGDYNGDGVVDASDYTVWRDHFGDSDESAINFNGDGIGGIDAADYHWWYRNFGNMSSASMSVAEMSVPEPTALSLLLIACSVGVRGRRARELSRASTYESRDQTWSRGKCFGS